jgi:stage III sporulation protein AG
VSNNFKKVFDDIFKRKGGENNSKPTMDESGKKSKAINSNLLTNLVIMFLVGVLLLIVGSMFTKDKSPKSSGSGTANVAAIGGEQMQNNIDTTSSAVDKAYKEKMQEELISLLERIQGVGKVHSMIYFESGQEQVPVFNEETSTSVTSEKDNGGGQRDITQENGGSTVVMENKENEQQPFITKTYNPTITGICVVAEGAGDSITELRIRQAVTKLFGLSDDKVQVYPMKK